MPSLRAHQVSSVELEFLKLDTQWRLLGEMDIAYMLPETRIIPDGLPLSREAVMKSPPEELIRIRKETENTLRKLLRFTFAGKDVSWRIEFPDFEKESFALPEEAGDIALLTTRLLIDPIPGAGDLRIHWSGEQETELIILIEETDESVEPQVISTLPGGSLMLLKQTDTGKSQPVDKPVAGGWLESGFRHVIQPGRIQPDHILFILGLFLLVPQWKPLMQQSLLFTLAHSITLALVAFKWVALPGIWIEHLVILSLAWVGVENLLLRRQLGKQRLIFVFCFGLLHGLSFASVLVEKLKDLSGSRLVGPLLGFNVGVELAQISIFALAFLLIWPLKKYILQTQIIGSALVAITGIAWFIQRLIFPEYPLF